MNIDIRPHDIRVMTDKETANQLGARYVKGNVYQLPKNIHAVRELLQFSNNIELKSLYEKMVSKQGYLLEFKQHHRELEGFEQLRPYQQQDLYFLSCLPHAGVFSEQRTGEQV